MRWTHETVAEEAKKYNNKSTFEKGSSGAYQYAHRHEIIEDVCKGMSGTNVFWTPETATAEALKYTTRNAFKKGSSAAYKYATSKKLMDVVCAHIPKRKPWSKELFDSFAVGYGNIREFRKDHPRAYSYATRMEKVAEWTSHMVRPTMWSHETVANEAKKYTTRNEFQNLSSGAYFYAFNNGLVDEVCSHMVNGLTTDEDMVYLWRIPNTNICKIGLSSVRRGDARIVEVARDMKVDYEILTMCHVTNAREIEKELHETYQILPTTLPKAEGYTEFRVLSDANIHHIVDYLENIVGDVV